MRRKMVAGSQGKEDAKGRKHVLAKLKPPSDEWSRRQAHERDVARRYRECLDAGAIISQSHISVEEMELEMMDSGVIHSMAFAPLLRSKKR